VVLILSASKVNLFSAIVLLFVLSSILTFPMRAADNREAALSTISNAEESIVLAYQAVLNGEEAGANITGLLVKLNGAAKLFSEARTEFEIGNFEETIRVAGLSNEAALEVEGEARKLKIEAGQARINGTWWSVVGSVLAVSFVLFISFSGYQVFKRRYYKRLLKMKPRVG
jgi:hypothetical protein